MNERREKIKNAVEIIKKAKISVFGVGFDEYNGAICTLLGLAHTNEELEQNFDSLRRVSQDLRDKLDQGYESIAHEERENAVNEFAERLLGSLECYNEAFIFLAQMHIEKIRKDMLEG